jgi:WD40 repeat protein
MNNQQQPQAKSTPNPEQIRKQIKSNIHNQKQFQKTNNQMNDKKLLNEGMSILRNCPQMHTDTIQDMEFVELGNNILLISVSWDQSLIIWNCQAKPSYNTNKKLISLEFSRKIELGCYGLGVKYYQELNMVLINCGDCTIKMLDLQSQQVQTLINLSALALDFFYIPQMNCHIIITLDGKLNIYSANNLQQPMTFQLPRFPLAADINEDLMIIAMNNNAISVFSINSLLNNFNGNFQLQKNLLESPISKIKINKANMTFTAVTIDSRIMNSDFMMDNTGQIQIARDTSKTGKTFIFMGHGIKAVKNKPNLAHAYNINSLNYNSQISTFMASGCADGTVTFWDVNQRSKIFNFDFKESLSCGSISKSGRFAAYAIGYDWSKAYWDTSMAPVKPTIGVVAFREELLKLPQKLK